MPKEVGGGPKITGDDKREVVKFHKELTGDRVHSLRDLKDVLEPFEESPEFRRQNLPNKSFKEYLGHYENKHWGNPRYRYTPETSPNVEGYLALQYSPWLNEEKDILIQGRAGLENFEKVEEPIHLVDEYQDGVGTIESDYLEYLGDGDDMLWISIPTNLARPITFHSRLMSGMRMTASQIEKEK